MPQTAVSLDVNWLPEREVAPGFQHSEPAPHHTVVFSLHETLLRKGCHARRARLPCPPDRPAGSPRQLKPTSCLACASSPASARARRVGSLTGWLSPAISAASIMLKTRTTWLRGRCA